MVVSGTGVEVQPVDRSERVNSLARNARGSSIPTTSRVTGKAAPSPRKRLSASQVKKSWETIEKRVCIYSVKKMKPNYTNFICIG